MTVTLHVCRYCNEPIPDPDDAVLVAQVGGNSGPGWNIWAHRVHADLVEPDPVAIRIMARILITQALGS